MPVKIVWCAFMCSCKMPSHNLAAVQVPEHMQQGEVLMRGQRGPLRPAVAIKGISTCTSG